MRVLLSTIAAGALAVCAAAPAQSQSQSVVIGVPNWPSAKVGAHVMGQLLESELDVSARLRPAGTAEILGAIDRGEVDVHPEIWLPNLANEVAQHRDELGTLALSPKATRAAQNMCTTRQTQEATGLTSVSDLSDPEMAAHFDTDDDGRGEMWIGAHEWSSTKIERVRARSYGYNDTMLLLEMPEPMAMAAVDAAVVTGTPIVFYCYSPHFVFELHDIVRLEEPDHDPSTWSLVSPNEDPAWLVRSSAGSAWEPSTFQVGYASAIDEDMPQVAAFLKAVSFTAEEATHMSYAIDVEGREPEEVAAEWIEANATRWKEWVE